MANVSLNPRDQGIIFVPPQSASDPRVPTAEELTAQSELLNRAIINSFPQGNNNKLIILGDNTLPLSEAVREVGFNSKTQAFLQGHPLIQFDSNYRIELPGVSADQTETLYLVGFFYEVTEQLDSGISFTFEYRNSDGIINTVEKENTRRIRSGWILVNTSASFGVTEFKNLLSPQSNSRRFTLSIPSHTTKSGWSLQNSPKIQGWLGGMPVQDFGYTLFEDGIQVLPLISIDRTAGDGDPDFSSYFSGEGQDIWEVSNSFVSNGENNSNASRGVFLGAEAGGSATGRDNIAIGYRTANSLLDGTSNTIIGTSAGSNLTQGIKNTLIGSVANVTGNQTDPDTASFNVAIGYGAGGGFLGSESSSLGCVYIGVNAARDDSPDRADNRIAIGRNATVNTDNVAVIGNTILASIQNEGDGTCDLGAVDHRFKDIYATNGTIQTSTLAEKSAIAPSLGLDFIEDLHPVSFQWKNQADNLTHYGLILEEVEALEIDGITRENGIVYTELIPPLIKAVQQLSERVAELETKVNG